MKPPQSTFTTLVGVKKIPFDNGLLFGHEGEKTTKENIIHEISAKRKTWKKVNSIPCFLIQRDRCRSVNRSVNTSVYIFEYIQFSHL